MLSTMQWHVITLDLTSCIYVTEEEMQDSNAQLISWLLAIHITMLRQQENGKEDEYCFRSTNKISQLTKCYNTTQKTKF